MDFWINFLIYVLVLFPIVTVIHEFGHAFFAKVFSQDIQEISLGMGEEVFRKGLFKVRSAYFAFGWVKLNEEKMSKWQHLIFLMGGILFNFVVAVTLDLVTGYEFFVFRNYLDSFIFLSYLQVVVNIIPLAFIHGDSDGKQVMQVLRN